MKLIGILRIWMGVFAALCLGAGPVVAAIVSADSADTVVDSRDPAAITVQPVSATVNPGTSVSLSVTATGGMLSYQWRKGGANIVGATSATYTINPVAESHEGSYDVVVSNGLGSVTSSAVTLSVNDPVVIMVQPVSQGVLQGAGVSFAVTATGTGPLSYQWRLNGTNISGATAATYTIASVNGTDAGTYTCAVTNVVGTVVSGGAVLTVGPAITVQPVSATVNPGTSVSLSITATGSSLSYQWRKGGANIVGATSATYAINPVAESHEGSYDVVVSNGLGSVTSSAVTLSVNDPVVITVQPVSQGVLQGAGVSFAVTATATGPLSYQWKLNGTNISGATAATYTIASVNGTDAGTYTCAVTNVVGTVVSGGAVLTVGPAITVQPVSATVNPGTSVSLSITATGSSLSYQWRKGGVNISGATSATYTINPVAESHEGSYDVVVSNSVGSVTSSAVVLSVNDPVVITVQPVSQSVYQGFGASLSVEATGTAVSYQWKLNGNNISGATSATYTIASVNGTHAGTYTCAVTNVVGTVVSSAAVLTVGPAITVQPVAQSVNPGTSATLSVTATGSGPLYYQWRKAGVDIAGATSAMYTINPVAESHEGSYTVRVSNVLGGLTSSAAFLSVNDPVVITAQPGAIVVNPGAAAVFTVGVSGTGPFTYQWKKGASNITGATGATYTIPASAQSDEGTYSVAVTNVVGTLQSAGASLLVNDPVVITSQPTARTVNPGTSTTFSVGVSGTGPFTYQWRRGGVGIPGATGASYTMGSVVKWDEGSYDVVVGNVVGSVTSTAAALAVNHPVVITTQPLGRGVVPGTPVVFTVAATGTAPLTYQWSKDGVAIGGATSTSFGVVSPSSEDAGVYTVAVSNAAGTAVSSGARLTLNDFGITTQPVSRSVMPGGAASFTVAASGATGAVYQWRRNGVVLSGAVSATLAFTGVSAADAGEYSCVITSAEGVAVSNGALLTVGPAIVVQPAGVSAVGRNALALSVTAQGSEPMSYQWRKDGVSIAGATGAGYTVRALQSGDAGTYDVVVSNAVGSVTSAAAVVGVFGNMMPFSEWIVSWPGIADVRPEGDPDGDGVSNLMEYFAGSSPVAAGVEGRPSMGMEAGEMRFLYRRSKATSGVSGVVEFASGYPDPVWDSTGVTETVVDRGIYEEVTARIPVAAGDRRMLVRLRVSQ